ncbi:argininosuccinate lyase [bacterium]|nr:argininosuccinate lyase [bacterium]
MGNKKSKEYKGFGEAGIRLTEEALPDVVTHSSEHELPQLYACHMFDKAHLVMLAEENIIPRSDAALMLSGLREMEAEGVEKVRLETGGGIHSGEKYLINKLGEEIGGRIHIGRSSGDLDRVGDRIKQRDSLLGIIDAINAFREILLTTAADHVDTVMPGYTHGQHAQPLTFAHQLLAWASTLSRDFGRLYSALQRLNVSPAGAAIMTGSNFPINRHRTAELLGFDRPCENTLDAIHSPDCTLEVFSVIAILHSNLARWADDIIFWTGSDVGLVDLPDRFCGTSSILAQKKNPYAMEHIRGAAAQTIGGLMTAFFGEKGQTGLAIFSHNFYSKPALLTSFDRVVRELRWLTALVPETKLDTELMRKRAGAYWAQASDVAAALARDKGLSWRTAHQIVGILVRLCHERGIGPSEVDTDLLDEAAVQYTGSPIGLGEESLQKALDPLAFVKGRTLYGGPAPEESQRRIAELSRNLEGDREAVAVIRSRLQDANGKLERAIDGIIDRSSGESD